VRRASPDSLQRVTLEGIGKIIDLRAHDGARLTPVPVLGWVLGSGCVGSRTQESGGEGEVDMHEVH